MMNDCVTFRDILLEHGESYGTACKRLGAKVGQRIVRVQGETIRLVIAKNAGYQFVKALLAQCPADTVLNDVDGRVMFLSPVFSADGTGSYHDSYNFILISKEWEPLAEGAPIPRLSWILTAKEIGL